MANLNNDLINNETSESHSDKESKDSDSSNDEKSSFTIDGKIVQKTELKRLIKSPKPEDVQILNQLVLKIIKHDKYNIFEYLLDHGYKVNVLNSKGQTVVHISFYDECNQIHLRLGRKSFYDTYDYSSSAEIRSVLINTWMLEKSINLKYVDCNGLTYLHVACFLLRDFMGEFELISACLKSKIDVNAQFRDPKGFYGNFTALHFAVINSSNDSAEIVEKLLTPKTKVNAQDSLGRTPLHLACQVYRDPDDIDHLFNSFDTNEKPCILAPRIFQKLQNFYMNSCAIIKLLVRSGADMNLKDENGNTPLLSIFPEKYNEFARYNLDWHNHGVPIVETAMKFAHLLKNGAKVSVSNKNGDTILHLITRNLRAYRTSSEWQLLEFDDQYHLEMIKCIFNSGQKVNVNAKNKKDETPIQWAVESMSIDVMQLLLSHGADLNHLKFNSASDQKFFSYPDVVPNFEATQNVIAITKLILTKGFNLTPEIILKILNFLVHNVNECGCGCYRYMAFLYGSVSHIEHIFKNMFICFDEDMRDFTTYYYPITIGDLYIDKKVKKKMKKIIEKNNCSIDKDEFMTTSKIQNELILMKSIKITDNLNLHDLMTTHPYNVPYNIAKNFDYTVLENLSCFKQIIKAHFTKPILRRFVEKMCGDSLKELCVSLPHFCCQLVMNYLSNQDIVNVYSVVNALI